MENAIQQETPVGSAPQSGLKKVAAGYAAFKKYFGIIIMIFYRLRKVFMAAPVIYYALKLARYNSQHLPEEVGFFLQNSGAFPTMVDRYLAVMGPFVLTCACLFLMLFSRKAMYAWAISIFTLALPILILVSNIYPA